MDVTWENLEHTVQLLELEGRYGSVVGFINSFKADSLQRFADFERHVLLQSVDAMQKGVNVVLSTIHSAKGMEWDHVQIFDETLQNLSRFRVAYKKQQMQSATSITSPSSSSSSVSHAEMDWPSYDDDYNLW